MKSIWHSGIGALLFLLVGCAAAPVRDQGKNDNATLAAQLSAVSNKFELAKKENLNLKRELILFKDSYDIDSKAFIKAQDVFASALSVEEAKGQVGVRLSDRGLDIIISVETLFVSGSDQLSDEGKTLLDKIFDLIQDRFASNYIYVEGHTDNQSLVVFEWRSDRDFSFARALSVVEYFTEKKHMDPLRLSASGFGQYRPRATNETKEGRCLNRRIEIIISPQKNRPDKHL